MIIKITGRHVEVTESLKGFVDTKFLRIQRHFDHIIQAHVVLTLEKGHHLAEGVLHVSGGEIVAHGDAEDMYKAVDLLVDKLDRQLVKHKEKVKNHH